jgi:hypothetical protein
VLSVATFFQNWPEFAEVNPTFVQAALGRAASRMGGPDYTVWGQPTTPTVPPAAPATLTIVDSAQGYYAAHLLISSPMGMNLRIDTKAKGKNQYLMEFEELELAVGGGFAVAGSVV